MGEPRGRLGDHHSSLLVLMTGAAGANNLEGRMFVVYTNITESEYATSAEKGRSQSDKQKSENEEKLVLFVVVFRLMILHDTLTTLEGGWSQ